MFNVYFLLKEVFRETNMEEVSFGDNHLIFEAGTKSDFVFLILSGKVGVYLPSNQSSVTPNFVLGENEIFGEMGVISNSLRTATIRCIGDVKLLKISSIQFNKKIDETDLFVRGLIKVLISRISEQNKKSSKQKENFSEGTSFEAETTSK